MMNFIVNIKRKLLIKKYKLNKFVLFLDPYENFDKCIIGYTHDKEHLVYSYEKIIDSFTKYFMKQWKHGNYVKTDDDEVPDFELDAIDFVEYNTIRSLPYYYNKKGPYVVMEELGYDVESCEEDEKFDYIPLDK